METRINESEVWKEKSLGKERGKTETVEKLE